MELCIGRVAHATRGDSAHASAGTGGEKGQKRVFWRSERDSVQKKRFRGCGKQRPKEVLLDVPSTRGLIDQMGLRIRMSELYQESQLNLQPGALVISKKLRITFTCFQTKAAPVPRVQIQIKKKLGIGKDKSHGKSAVVKKKKLPEYQICRARCR